MPWMPRVRDHPLLGHVGRGLGFRNACPGNIEHGRMRSLRLGDRNIAVNVIVLAETLQTHVVDINLVRTPLFGALDAGVHRNLGILGLGPLPECREILGHVGHRTQFLGVESRLRQIVGHRGALLVEQKDPAGQESRARHARGLDTETAIGQRRPVCLMGRHLFPGERILHRSVLQRFAVHTDHDVVSDAVACRIAPVLGAVRCDFNADFPFREGRSRMQRQRQPDYE